MATIIEHVDKQWPLFEPGVAIPGVITGVRLLKRVPGFNGKLVDKLQIKILTNERSEDNEQMTALYSATASMHQDSNLRKFVKQVMNGDVGPSFDCELLVGRQANFVFETSTSKTTQKSYSNVSAVLKATTKVEIPAGHVAFREDDGNTVKQANQPAPRQRQTASVVPDDAPAGAVTEI